MRKLSSSIQAAIALTLCNSLILCGFLAATPAEALTPFALPENGHFGTNLWEHIEYLPGTSKADNQQPPVDDSAFRTLDSKTIGPDFWRFGTWARFSISNPNTTRQTAWLHVSSAFLDKAALYRHTRGELKPQEVEHSARRLLAPITLEPGETQTLYLQIHTSGPLNAEIQLSSHALFPEALPVHNMLGGLFFGILVAVSLYFLFIYFTHSQLDFLFAAFLALTTASAFFVLDGLLSLFPVASHIISIAFAASITMLVLSRSVFAWSFLELHSQASMRSRLALTFIALQMLLYPSICILYPASTTWLYATVAVSSLACFGIALSLLGQCRQRALYFLSGYSFQVIILAGFAGEWLGYGALFDSIGLKMAVMAEFLVYFVGLQQGLRRADKQKLDAINREQSHLRWHQLVDVAFESILIFKDSRIVEANNSCAEMLGFEPNELIGCDGNQFIAESNYKFIMLQIEKAANIPLEISIQRKDGTSIIGEIRCKPGTYDDEDVTIVAIRDISERKQYESELRMLGYYDSLTGLANRVLFRERLEHAISSAARVRKQHALLFVDLDQFKNVNDSLGHDIGDELLVEVGKRLSSNTRKEDTVARLGGDEFAIIMEDIHAPYVAAKVADQLMEAMGQTIQIKGLNLAVTPSIGIAIYPQDGDNISDLLKSADTAMYHAKNEGRNNYKFYTVDQNKKVVQRIELESELRKALENDEFFLAYQPRLDIKSGNIVGIEALVRWQSNQHGTIMPKEFIAVAEETHLIHPIGEIILRNACQQQKEWLDKGFTTQGIAVNLSSSQFNKEDLSHTIKNILEETGLPPGHLELEMTETAIINNAEKAVTIMEELKEIGVKLSIDDFGTGYSSLSHLKRFPIDMLKVDRSFIRDIESNPEDLNIATTVINLAHSLKLKVVAEGVENPRQLKVLRSLDCDEMQGYLYSKPVPASEVEIILANQPNLYKMDKQVS
jgi:diguanylate cyclase (GGDEF)-like protein/PAS domain S-box-containing protein